MKNHARNGKSMDWTEDKVPPQVKLSLLEMRLLNEFQQSIPMTTTPYADIAARLEITEARVLQLLQKLHDDGVISRVGPVFPPQSIGVSTLAAMAIPEERLESVAGRISLFAEVNHNYEREHEFNLWFVLTASTQERLDEVLAEIEALSGCPVMSLPLLRHFHIDLGFPLWC